MKILGISPAHDSSACLIEDGEIVSFYKEERIVRKKRASLPYRSIEKIFEDNPGKIDGMAFCGVEKNENSVFNHIEFVKKFSSFDHFLDLTQNHHLQHASLAFYNSGFESAGVIVIDRNGSIHFDGARESESIFIASYPDNIKEIYKNYWVFNSNSQNLIKNKKNDDPYCEIDARSMFGIVKVYESATSLIGQHPLENGKTMGLSSYGKDNDFPNFFINNTNIVNDYYFGHENIFGNNESYFFDLNFLTSSNITENNYQIYADFAYQVQKQTQDAAAYLISKAIEKTGINNIVISGGYGLNVVANNFYHKKFPDVNFYIEPIADDTGNSIGGAMFLYRSITKDKNIRPLNDLFFHGKKYDLTDIKKISKKVSGKDIAKLILNNKSVAIYNGLAEAGPRALGNRSIVFNAMNKNGKEIVNKIKKREWYRPFAAAVLEEDAPKIFDMLSIDSSPYMTISFNVKEEFYEVFPCVVHVDKTCRIQTVDKANQAIYNLLQEIKEKVGYGIVLNTSFNLAGEPLVETPQEAIETFKNSMLDVLWFPEISSAIIKESHEKNNL